MNGARKTAIPVLAGAMSVVLLITVLLLVPSIAGTPTAHSKPTSLAAQFPSDDRVSAVSEATKQQAARQGERLSDQGQTSRDKPGRATPPAISLPKGVTWAKADKMVTIESSDGLTLVVNYNEGVVVESLSIDATELLDPTSDSSRISVVGGETVTATAAEDVRARPTSNGFRLSFDIPFDGGTSHEVWDFEPRGESVAWIVNREFSIGAGTLAIAAGIGELVFDRDVWENVRRLHDGGNVPVWGDKLVNAAVEFSAIDGLERNGILLETAPNHAVFDSGDLVFLSHDRPLGLAVDVTTESVVASELARRGTPEAAAGLAAGWRLSDEELVYGNGNAKGYASRFSEIADQALLASPQIANGHEEQAEFLLSVAERSDYYSGADLEGIDSEALSQLVNDFGRTIVQGSTIGASSERSFRAGEAPGFTSPWNVWSLELLQDEGAFDSMRHQFTDIFASPKRNPDDPNALVDGKRGGLQDEDGRIHCCVPFGAVKLSQPTYATTDNTFNVVFSASTLYNLDPDAAWLEEIAPSVRLALKYAEKELLVTSGPAQGLFANAQCADPQAATGCFTDWSEWNDQYDIGQVSAYHNVFAYAALTAWAELEREVLGSVANAHGYEALAAGLKERYNAAGDDGGFWSTDSTTFAYTRDETGALVKDCSHLFANGYALMFDLVDSDARRLTVASSLRDEYDRLETTGHVYDHGAQGGTDYTWKVHGANPTSCASGETLSNGWPRMYFPFFEDGGAHLLNEQPAAQMSLVLGDRSRNVDFARTVVDRYMVDGFMGWSNIQPDTLEPRRDIWQEPFMVNNVLGVWALYHDVLGFQPHHDRLDIIPFIDESMVGSEVDYRLRGAETVSVGYESTDRYRVSYDGEEDIRIGWQREPNATYQLTIDGVVSTVTADARGKVWVDAPTGAEHTFELFGDFGIAFDDDVMGFSDGWSAEAGGAYLGETAMAASGGGETATLNFAGTGATILATTDASSGIARVTLDGVELDEEDWYSPSTAHLVRLVSVSGLEQAEHELVITIAGAHSPMSLGNRVAIDGVVIFGGAPMPPDPNAPADVEVHPSMFTYTGGWWGVADAAYLLGELRGTSEAGATATLAFTGTGVTLSGSTGGDKGLASIRIDGEEVATEDWFAVTPANQQAIYSVQGLEPGRHVLEIVVLGTSSAGSVGVQVNLDGAIVRTGGAPLTTTIAPNQFAFTGGWWGVADPAYLSGELRGTSETGATASLTFTGTGVALSGSTGGDKGRASISINGGAPEIVDWYAASPANRVTLFSVGGLSPGAHTMVVTVLGERDPASVGDQVNFDGAIVAN